MKIKISLTPEFLNYVDGFRPGVAGLIARIVWEEFEELLWTAPQMSGNYVANLRIQTGSRSGSKGGTLVYPIPEKEEGYFKRGSLPAISYALSQNLDFVARATRNIKRGAGWLPMITVYNLLPYAGVVEDMDKLRLENRGGEHAVKQFEERLQARFNHTIPYVAVV